MLFWVAFAIITLTNANAQSSPNPDCLSGWEQYGQRCFVYMNMMQKWSVAKSTCEALESQLVEIYSAGENNFIKSMMGRFNSQEIWIGGNDIDTEGEWVWAESGQNFKNSPFTDWGKDQPDTYKPRDENCVEFDILDKGGHWNDDQCYHEKRFICAMPIQSILVG